MRHFDGRGISSYWSTEFGESAHDPARYTALPWGAILSGLLKISWVNHAWYQAILPAVFWMTLIWSLLRFFIPADGLQDLIRKNQTSFRKVADAMTGIKQIGLMFSVAFFLTAALVTWITVSRMMENQRQYLGTLRSLGFSKKEITGRYALFGVLITIPSMILGWLISRYLLAEFLYDIGITYYTIEATGVTCFMPHFFEAAMCVAAVTCGTGVLSCHKSLRSTPAALMRTKPPAQGHRVLLEKITPLWRRLSFSGKIVTRNLFRNKARMLGNY